MTIMAAGQRQALARATCPACAGTGTKSKKSDGICACVWRAIWRDTLRVYLDIRQTPEHRQPWVEPATWCWSWPDVLYVADVDCAIHRAIGRRRDRDGFLAHFVGGLSWAQTKNSYGLAEPLGRCLVQLVARRIFCDGLYPPKAYRSVTAISQVEHAIAAGAGAGAGKAGWSF